MPPRTFRDEDAARIADQLPDTEAGLFADAQASQAAFHKAIMAGQHDQADHQAARYQVAIFKLNGRTFFGCRAGADSPAARIAEACAAPAGTPTEWGQAGSFLVTANGVRACVVIEPWSLDYLHTPFHAVDWQRLYISSTGYRSDFLAPAAGRTPQQALTERLSALIDENPPCAITSTYRDRLPAWCADLPPAEAAGYRAEKTGQLAFL